MQKKTDSLYATPHLKWLSVKLANPKLSDEVRKMIVIAIASEPRGVSKPHLRADLLPSPINTKALTLLDMRDLSPSSLKMLIDQIGGMVLGRRAANHAEVQSARMRSVLKFFHMHSDEFYFVDIDPPPAPHNESDKPDSKVAESPE